MPDVSPGSPSPFNSVYSSTPSGSTLELLNGVHEMPYTIDSQGRRVYSRQSIAKQLVARFPTGAVQVIATEP